MTITVVIPAYNSGRYLARTIDSVLAQSRRAEEIIVVDDSSTDDTVRVVQRYGSAVVLIRQDNAGASAARNTGIKAAPGEWIAFLDADDEWLPDKLKLQTEHIERNPHLKWTTGNFYRCRCRSNHLRIPDMSEEQLKRDEGRLSGREFFESYFQAYLAGAAGWTGTMMIRKDTLIEAGLFDTHLPRMNDVDMWLRIAYLNLPIGFLSQPTAVYHEDVPDSIVKVHSDQRIICDFMDRHLELAESAGFSEQFRPCAAQMLGWWIHCRLLEKQGKQVRMLLLRYGRLLTPYCRVTTYIRTLLPRTSLLYESIKRKIFPSGW